MKSFWLKSLVSAALVTVAVPAFAADYTLNVNTALTTSDPLYKGLESFVENVAKASGGKMEVRLFPNSQLGPDEDVLEQARTGAPVAVVVDGGRLANFQKEFGVLGAPYLASGYDGIRKVVTSPLFEGWAKKLHDGSGLQVLSFNWWQGERQLWTQKPVKTPDDLKGVRMRTIGSPVWLKTIGAMGATATPMPYADVYSALQQNVIDAVEAQLPAGQGSKLYEVTKVITKTHHINLITGLVTSGPWFDGLPADLQKMLREEALKAGDVASHGTGNSLASLEDQLKKEGMTINEIDTTPFEQATAGVYDELGYGDLHAELKKIVAGQ
ncbi:C4-dicarboxylate TRAP transporter substrate-binding protein [Radicibacter daui]|uniref:C4-dicarboxylate TRAP transporter substrate-binding protein n=1 Tax=Radicibacter daui TaxID=3064829 RepID=UPI004046ECD0